MSHHISLYTEWRDKGTNEWHLAGNGPVTLDFKHIILGDRGCWSENDRFNSFAELDPASLSPELKEYYKKALSETPRFVQFRAIDLIEYESRINDVIERRAQKAVLEIRKKFGRNAILKGMNLEEGATGIERNSQVGGHRG